MTDLDLPSWLDLERLAIDLVRSSGTILMERTIAGLRTSMKDHNHGDVVTDVDLELEDYLATRLYQLRPMDGFLGEEGTVRSSESGVTWIADPIDGTSSLASGAGSYSISLAAQTDGRSVAGAVFAPQQDSCYSAALGYGARLNGQTTTTTPTDCLADAVIATDFGSNTAARSYQTSLLTLVAPKCRAIRILGSTALHVALVGAGRLDAVYMTSGEVWDTAAASLAAAEAGATLSSLDGGTMRCDNFIVAAPGIHSALLDALSAR